MGRLRSWVRCVRAFGGRIRGRSRNTLGHVRPADRLFFTLVERFFIDDLGNGQLTVDADRVAEIARQVDGDGGVIPALAAFDALVESARVVGRPARAKTHTLEFRSVAQPAPDSSAPGAGGIRATRGTMVLRVWAVDQRLFIERLADSRRSM